MQGCKLLLTNLITIKYIDAKSDESDLLFTI